MSCVYFLNYNTGVIIEIITFGIDIFEYMTFQKSNKSLVSYREVARLKDKLLELLISLMFRAIGFDFTLNPNHKSS